MNKIYWSSQNDLSSMQLSAIHAIHGEYVIIIKDQAVISSVFDLENYIKSHSDGLVYTADSGMQYIDGALSGLRFAQFVNHTERLEDGTFGLAVVYHVHDGSPKKVWVNNNPKSNTGWLL